MRTNTHTHKHSNTYKPGQEIIPANQPVAGSFLVWRVGSKITRQNWRVEVCRSNVKEMRVNVQLWCIKGVQGTFRQKKKTEKQKIMKSKNFPTWC